MEQVMIETFLPAVILMVGVGVVLALILQENRCRELFPTVVVFGFIAAWGMAAIAAWIAIT
jgi:uncharacterized membrane protein YebE (DUF533 family)